jgi:hypothetical protein
VVDRRQAKDQVDRDGLMSWRAGLIVSLVLAGCGSRTGLNGWELQRIGDPPHDAGVVDADSGIVDAQSDAPSAPEDAGPPPPNGPIRVAVLDVDPGHCRARMERVVEQLSEPLAVIPLESELDVLADYDLVILCAGWAYDRAKRARVLERASTTQAYVEQGGGFLMFQPNDIDAVNIDLVQYWFKDYAGFTYHDDPEIHVHDHPVTSGLVAEDAPYPTDQILDMDPRWNVLARGSRTHNPSLLVGEHSGRERVGRFALDLDNPINESYPEQKPHHSDRLLQRLSSWLMHRL